MKEEMSTHELHELKTWPEYFELIWNGIKKFEVRKDDRDFRAMDSLLLKEYDPKTGTYSGRACKARVGYVLRDYPAIKTGYVVFELKNVQPIYV